MKVQVVGFLFCGVVFSVHSNFAIILLKKSGCRVAYCVSCLFFVVPWVGMWSVIVAFPGHTHLLFQYT